MLRKERHIYSSRKTKVATVAMVKSGCLNDKNSPIAEAQTNSNSQKIQPLFIHQWIQRLRVPSQTAFTVSLSGFSWISALVDRCSKEIHGNPWIPCHFTAQNMFFFHLKALTKAAVFTKGSSEAGGFGLGADLFWDFFLFFGDIFFFLVCGLCACFLSSSRGVVGWCFCGGVCVVMFLWWCGWVVFLWWCFCGGVVVLLCFCGGVVVFLWWCFCGVLVVVFLWWCSCGGVFVVVWWCFCGVPCGGVFGVVFLWWCFCGGVCVVWLCFCGGVVVFLSLW